METLNKKGLRKIYEIQKEVHRKVQEVMEEDECKGDMPIFSIGCMDMFFFKRTKKRRGGG